MPDTIASLERELAETEAAAVALQALSDETAGWDELPEEAVAEFVGEDDGAGWSETPERHAKDAQGHEHKGKGPGGGQFTAGAAGGGGESESISRQPEKQVNENPHDNQGWSGGFNGRGGNDEFVRFGQMPPGGRSVNNIDDSLEDGVSAFRLREDAQGLYFSTGESGSDWFEGRPIFLVRGNEVGTGSDGEPLFDAATAKTISRLKIERDGYKWRIVEEEGPPEEGPERHSRADAALFVQVSVPERIALPLATNLPTDRSLTRADFHYRESPEVEGIESPSCRHCSHYMGKEVIPGRLGKCFFFEHLHDADPARYLLAEDVGAHMLCDAWSSPDPANWTDAMDGATRQARSFWDEITRHAK